MSVELKPCPFCGGNKVKFDPRIGVYCETCNVWVGYMKAPETMLAAIWNRRTPTKGKDEA
jgi:hypothetical protein